MRLSDEEAMNSVEKIRLHDRLWDYALFRIVPSAIKPNHITFFRLVATPWVLILIVMENYLLAIPAFFLVALTDSIDGSLARVRKQITEWGKIYDPVADKILIGSVIYLIVMKYLDFYLGLFIILMEVAFIAFGYRRLKKGYTVEANTMGKVKMALQVLGVLILLIGIATGWTALLPFSEATFYLAITFAILSLLTHGV